VSELDYFALANGLIGGLALFLYGMRKLTEALSMAAGDKLQRMLARLTTNRFSAAGAGALITAVIQSSSITTVMVVSFVSAGVLGFSQSVGVIVGANIGTTITAQIIAFKVTAFALAMIAGGFLIEVAARRSRHRHLGVVLMGLGMLFYGMNLMSEATAPLRDYPPFLDFMRDLRNPMLAMLTSAGFTALVQSSSATTGIIIVFASQGFIALETGIALVIGANLGTCVTAMLSTIGRSRDAVKVGVVHVLFNLSGALLFIGFVPAFAELVRLVTPAASAATAVTLDNIPRQIANAHTLFNVTMTALFLGFTDTISRVVEHLVPKQRDAVRDAGEAKYLDRMFLSQPATALVQLQRELERLGKRVKHALRSAQKAALVGDEEALQRTDDEAAVAARLHEAIVNYSGEVSLQALTEAQRNDLEQVMNMAACLEGLRELAADALRIAGRRRLQRGTVYNEELLGQLSPLTDLANDGLTAVLNAHASQDREAAAAVIAGKENLYRQAEALRLRLARQLPAEGRSGVATYIGALEYIENLKRIHALTRRIARLVAGPDSADPAIATAAGEARHG
jgi:phosphate:Na+ symporter